MNWSDSFCHRLLLVIITATMVACASYAGAQPAGDGGGNGEIRIVALQGSVELMPAGAQTWVLTQTNQVLHASDRLRTDANSRVTLLWYDRSVVPFGALTEVEILPPDNQDSLPGLHIFRGIGSFFHRDKPGRINVLTHGATASIEGTEFVVEVSGTDGQEQSRFSVIDGKVRLTNKLGTLVLTNNQQGVAEPTKAPVQTAGFIANNVLQWCFYYPAVLDTHELPLTADEENVLGQSLAAYRSGDLPGALAKYPPGRQPGSPAERIYHAALLLSVGQVAPAETDLSSLSAGPTPPPIAQLAQALRRLIAAVKHETDPSPAPPKRTSALLAASYYAQSRTESATSLNDALALAYRAAARSPDFGFAWERVAELEFSFGRSDQATPALELSLRLSPRNAQAVALKGFLLAANNQSREAIQWFDRALALDPALGNAWLGRGLCRIHTGDAKGGREDLLIAAATEPNRAVLRSYLGKAFSQAGDDRRAGHELELARKLDPNDPTSWLYSALLHQEENHINEAIRDLEKSEALNDNRSVYRSRLLLDEDAAVRGANLAGIYSDAGMDEVSAREATRAVNEDYANYSAHLFLANSYNQLRDPNQINLRYETPWLSEFLVANLLAPVGAGTLSQNVSQQEYSKLFAHNGFGGASSTEYTSRGDWTESGSQYGSFDNFGYAVDTDYLSDNGQRPNNGQNQLTVSTQLKWDVTPRDSFFVQAIYYDATAGDLKPYYNQQSADLSLGTHETQEPLLLLGYRHEWSPGVETLALAGRFNDSLNVTSTNDSVLLLAQNGGAVIAVPTPALPTAPFAYQSTLDIYSAEVLQILEKEDYSLLFGGRAQAGTFDTQTALGGSTPTLLSSLTQTTSLAFATSPISQDVSPNFTRWTGYGYFNWQPLDPLQLDAGVTYDNLEFPQNFRNAPVSSGEQMENQVSPKAGFTWTPRPDTVLRFAYTRSLGGVSFDQSVQLEPSQVAGFNQAFRSLIPEAVAGSTSGAKFETFNLALEQKFKTGTYVGIEADILNSLVDQTIGAVNLNFPPTYSPGGTPQNLNYTEKNLIVTLNQLVGDYWSLGARYQLSRAELDTAYPDLPASVTSASQTQNTATLHQLALFALLNLPSGFYARAEGDYYSQDSGGYQPALSGDAFWQVNLAAGYRFWHRRAQAQVGVLNLTGQEYQLNPLNLYNELPRQRTFTFSLQFYF